MDKRIKKELEKNLQKPQSGIKNAIKIFFMENFRKLSMGIDAQIQSLFGENRLITGRWRFGDENNYSEFESDGTIVFKGNATTWKDAQIDVLSLTPIPARQPDIVQMVDEDGDNMGIYSYGFNVNEGVGGHIEIPHDYKEGSNIIFHIHYYGIGVPTGTDYVKWQLTYSVGRAGTTQSPTTTITKEGSYDTQYKSVRIDFDAIVGTNFKIEDQISFSLDRVTATGDAYVGDALTKTIGFHYEKDTVGSRQTTTK